MMIFKKCTAALSLTLLMGVNSQVCAQEALIKKNLSERLPNLPKIEEVTPTPVPGWFEVRLEDGDLIYADAQGNHVMQGELIDTRAKRNLTRERQEKISAIKFSDLPLKDAIVITKGSGKRRVAIFEDPNCGYCKRFEKDIHANLKDVTLYVYLYPVLGPDSLEKSRNIWCAKDPGQAWVDWMTKGREADNAKCDNPIQRNLELGRKYRITGTPTLIFSDGKRVPGALPASQVENLLLAASPR